MSKTINVKVNYLEVNYIVVYMQNGEVKTKGAIEKFDKTRMSKRDIFKALKEKHNTPDVMENGILIKETTKKSAQYTMTMDDFLLHADLMEVPEVQEDTEKQEVTANE